MGKEKQEIKVRRSGKKDRAGVRIIVKPVYVGTRPMAEVIGDAVADNLKHHAGTG